MSIGLVLLLVFAIAGAVLLARSRNTFVGRPTSLNSGLGYNKPVPDERVFGGYDISAGNPFSDSLKIDKTYIYRQTPLVLPSTASISKSVL